MYHAKNELFSEPLIEYLMDKGWELMESEPDIAVLRKCSNNEEEDEIVLPRNRSYADYHLRIKEAVRFLANYEQTTENGIIEELLHEKWDTLRIRISGDRIGNGSISFLDKGIIEEGVRKILLASACSIQNPKLYFKRLYSSTAEQWMRKCHSHADESGSYILTVRFPLEMGSEDSKIPFSRKVGEYLMSSLSSLAFLSGKPEVNLDMQSAHLNANFCLGLAEMKPDEAPINFGFEMSWSAGIPLNNSIPSKVVIDDRCFSSIIRIGHKLMPQTEVNQDVFVGKVLSLHGLPDDAGNMQGEVTLILLLDEQQTKAKAFLGPEFYSQACDAHKHNNYVRISGILSEKPRCSDLNEITHFTILE